jgi:hypothetical protein
MTSEDELKGFEAELRAFRPAGPSPGLHARILREISDASASRASRGRRWPRIAAAAALLAAAAWLAGAYFAGHPVRRVLVPRDPAQNAGDMTAWRYAIAASGSRDALFQLLDRQAAQRNRPGPVTGGAIDFAESQTTPIPR